MPALATLASSRSAFGGAASKAITSPRGARWAIDRAIAPAFAPMSSATPSGGSSLGSSRMRCRSYHPPCERMASAKSTPTSIVSVGPPAGSRSGASGMLGSMHDLVVGADGRKRCGWCASASDYVAYHDDEWGRPVRDDDRLFEKLCLEGFQSGLSWLTILRKREGFRQAFAGFRIEAVARFGPADVERLLGDAGDRAPPGEDRGGDRQRRRGVAGAGGRRLPRRPGLVVRADAAGVAPRGGMADLPAVTPESTALAKELRRRGFRFVGPTTAYAFMQSMGLVNDHLVGCELRTPG